MGSARAWTVVVPLGVAAVAACSLDTLGEIGPPDGGVDSGSDRTMRPPPTDAHADGSSGTKDASRDVGLRPDRKNTDSNPGPDHTTPDAGCTADTGTDTRNCGACGHDCLGGSCVAGVCQPVIVTTSGNNQFALAVQGTTLYWTRGTQNTVDSCVLPACTTITNAGGCTGTWGIAVDPAHYYFSCNGQNQLYACANGSLCAGDAPIPSAQAPTGLTLDWANIYYLSASDPMGDMHTGGVLARPLDGGPSTLLRGAQDFPSSIAMVSGALFWTEPPDSAVSTCSVSPGPASCNGSYVQIVTGQSYPDQIAVDAAHVYFTNNGTMSMMFKDGSVVQADLDGKNLRTLAPSRLYPRGIVVDSAYVYWVDYVGMGATTGTVARAPIGGGGAVVTLATGQAAPIGLAEDDKALYWGNSGDGTIMMVAK